MTSAKPPTTRDRLIVATADLLERRGYSGTGLAEVLAVSQAPRGSLYFHFKGGKEALAAAALRHAGAQTCALLQAALRHAPDAGFAIERFTALLGDRLRSSEYQRGCPVATVALEGIDGPDLRAALVDAFDGWHGAIVDRLVVDGLPAARAAEVATFVLASIEGALLLAKAHRDTTPLARTAAELTIYLRRELAAAAPRTCP